MQDSLLSGAEQGGDGPVIAAAQPPAQGAASHAARNGCMQLLNGPTTSAEGNELVPRWWLFFLPL